MNEKFSTLDAEPQGDSEYLSTLLFSYYHFSNESSKPHEFSMAYYLRFLELFCVDYIWIY